MKKQTSSNTKKCLICFESKDDVEVMCPGAHLYCSECINLNFENMIRENKTLSKKCSLCAYDYFENKLEAILNPDVKSILIRDSILKDFKLPENLTLGKCDLCPNSKNCGIFLFDKNDHQQFYKCEKEDCKKTMCLYCYGEKKGETQHNGCHTYRNIMLDLEKVIDFTIIKECPKCKKDNLSLEEPEARMKDASCLHITCNKCNMQYCYICGGHEENIDRDTTLYQTPIYQHNQDWKTNSKRCPMYIRSLSEVICSWPITETEATAKFEKYKTMAFLKKVIDKHTFIKVKKTYDIFSFRRLSRIPSDLLESQSLYTNFTKYDLIDNKIFAINKI